MISIPTAKAFAKEHELEGVVILAIKDGQICTTSYGADTPKCRQLAKLNDAIAEMSLDADLSEFQP